MNAVWFVAGAMIGVVIGIVCMALMVNRRSDED